MIKVIIASKNPVKIQAVKTGFERTFPDQQFEFIAMPAASNVSDQPFSSDETYRGAKNRADNASKEITNADFYVGIEGGIEFVHDEIASFTWVVIKSSGKYGKSKTGTFFLPKKVVALIKDGRELGEAVDIAFESNNSKQLNGAVGILTKNLIDRTKLYAEAVILSLIPFKNIDLY
jgi:inosine/xanthosine triphosphatase